MTDKRLEGHANNENVNSERPKAMVRGSKETRYYQLDRLVLVAELYRVAKPDGLDDGKPSVG